MQTQNQNQTQEPLKKLSLELTIEEWLVVYEALLFCEDDADYYNEYLDAKKYDSLLNAAVGLRNLLLANNLF